MEHSQACFWAEGKEPRGSERGKMQERTDWHMRIEFPQDNTKTWSGEGESEHHLVNMSK